MYLTDDLPDIVEVLKHYGATMNRTTGQVNIKCPFHDDTHSSASFNTRENIFNCFACGMQGNSLQIIARQERVSIHEAKSFAEGITTSWSYGSAPIHVGTMNTIPGPGSVMYLLGKRLDTVSINPPI